MVRGLGNLGIGLVISVDTGEVLDYDFESKICRECQTAKKDLGEDSPEFSIWFGGHQDQCTQTHTGSSGSMECTIAKKFGTGQRRTTCITSS
jgi:hypothetical protein